MYKFLQINTGAAARWIEELKTGLIAFAPKIVSALLVLVIGLWTIRLLGKLIGRFMSARHYEASLQTFLLSFFKVTMNILLIILLTGMFRW